MKVQSQRFGFRFVREGRFRSVHEQYTHDRKLIICQRFTDQEQMSGRAMSLPSARHRGTCLLPCTSRALCSTSGGRCETTQTSKESGSASLHTASIIVCHWIVLSKDRNGMYWKDGLGSWTYSKSPRRLVLVAIAPGNNRLKVHGLDRWPVPFYKKNGLII